MLGAAAAASMLIAAWGAWPADPMLLTVAALAAAGALVAGRRPAAPDLEIGVDARGRLVARRGRAADPLEQGLQCVFAAPWLITLRSGTMWVPIWADAVPGNTFRRLWVHIRWNSARQPVDFPPGPAPDQPK